MAETDRIRWFDEVDSTNTQLAAARGELPDGTVFAALWQSAGKGQRGNRWESRSGENLTFSILWKPASLAAAAQFSLSEAAALGVSDYLAGEGLDSFIKWPNDIIAGGKKICGMLLEHSLAADKLADSVVGIGLNVNQRSFGEAPNATSMVLLTGLERDIKKELPRLLAALDRRFAQVGSEAGRAALRNDYLARLFQKDEWHEYLDRRSADPLLPTTRPVEGERFEGRITGLTPSGLLVVERRNGALLEFAFKEISYLF
ncbi:MAG: biotin--[Bacteroidales bacterium]|nr:biotin--[acetyl-CoA-carboxylase] ligase [Bacteroidales bacterium]